MVSTIQIIHGDCLDVLKSYEGDKIDLMYIDPPFNAGIFYKGDLPSYLEPRLRAARHILANEGSIFVHLDYREVHYVKVLMDAIFGRDNFQNEIIWAYDYGGRSKKVWPRKHDTILWYSRSKEYIFNYEAMDRIPYMAPGLQSDERRKRGKTPTDVWWHTIVPTQGYQRTGYPTQKPVGILRRIIRVHSHEDSNCMDFFAGSGSFGEACQKLGRNCVLVDDSKEAIRIMKARLL